MRDLGTFRALDHAFRLEVDEAIAAGVADLFAGMAASGARPATSYAIAAGADGNLTLRCDGTVTYSGNLNAVLQMLITLVGNSAVDEPITAVHGTTVVREGRGLLLAGPTGRGKSTLAAYLLTRGWSLVAEDISALTFGLVRPYHRPVGLSAQALQLVGGPDPDGVALGPRGKRLVGPAQLGYDLHGPVQVTVVALVDRQAHGLADLSAATMLARLLAAGLAQTPDESSDLAALIDLLAASRCVQIGSADLGAAAEALRWLAESPAPIAPQPLVEANDDYVTIYCNDAAVVVERARPNVHQLNGTAAAVWMLSGDGLHAAQIASALGVDARLVDHALGALEEAGLTDRVR